VFFVKPVDFDFGFGFCHFSEAKWFHRLKGVFMAVAESCLNLI
jgi:hypothetical protein